MSRMLCETCVGLAMDMDGPWECVDKFATEPENFGNKWVRSDVLAEFASSGDDGTDLVIRDCKTFFVLPVFAVTTVGGDARCALHVGVD